MVNPYKPLKTATDARPVTQDRLMKRRMLYASLGHMVSRFGNGNCLCAASPFGSCKAVASSGARCNFLRGCSNRGSLQAALSNQRRITRQQAGQENPQRFDEEI